MKRCSTALLVREIQSKTALRYHLMRMWRNRNPLALLVGTQPGAAALENRVDVPQTIKNRSTLRPSNSTARNLPKGYRSAET